MRRGVKFSQYRQADNHLAREHRIPLWFPGAIIGPFGLFIYGWVAQYRVHWIAVDMDIFVTCSGMQIQGMAKQAYVMNAYMEHTSSAMVASHFLRSLTKFFFSLFTPMRYDILG
jgi:hypothetical protein